MLNKEESKMEVGKEKQKKENAKKFFEIMANSIKDIYQARENEYFNLQLTIQDNAKYSNCITKNMFKLPIEAQIEVLKTLAKTAEVSKAICEKYGFDVEEW